MLNRRVKLGIPAAPDLGDVVDDLSGLADHAADAISSAAGFVPGLDDYRSAARRKRLLGVIGVVALVAVVAVVLKRRRDAHDT